MSAEPSADAKFDAYASSYASLHAESVRATGESSEYFAQHKLLCLDRLGLPATTSVLDYGCGIGSLTEQLVTRFQRVHGFDPSRGSVELARDRAPRATFSIDLGVVPDAQFDLAVVANVLHHVPPRERRSVIDGVRRKLAPKGKLVVFEHNPWNPLTRRAVASCPFDDDAILLWPREVKRLLSDSGFGRMRQDYVLFFPRFLASLRPLEPRLRWLMLGAQTMTVGERTD